MCTHTLKRCDSNQPLFAQQMIGCRNSLQSGLCNRKLLAFDDCDFSQIVRVAFLQNEVAMKDSFELRIFLREIIRNVLKTLGLHLWGPKKSAKLPSCFPQDFPSKNEEKFTDEHLWARWKNKLVRLFNVIVHGGPRSSVELGFGKRITIGNCWSAFYQ